MTDDTWAQRATALYWERVTTQVPTLAITAIARELRAAAASAGERMRERATTTVRGYVTAARASSHWDERSVACLEIIEQNVAALPLDEEVRR